jgi:hypothetical protein
VTKSTIADVKNVATLRYTDQLKDYMDYAISNAPKKGESGTASEFGLIIRDNTELHPDLKGTLCSPPAGVTIFVKYLPDVNGGGLSENMINQICK